MAAQPVLQLKIKSVVLDSKHFNRIVEKDCLALLVVVILRSIVNILEQKLPYMSINGS